MKSMTAFSKAITNNKKYLINVEIKTYNSKNIDYAFFVPKEYMFLKDKIQKIVSSKIKRGRVELRFFIERKFNEAYNFELDIKKLKAYKKAISKIDKLLGTKTNLSTSFLLKESKIIKENLKIDEEFQIVEKTIFKAINELDKMRKKEGTFLSKDILKRLKFIETNINKIEKKLPPLLPKYKAKLKKRIEKFNIDKIKIDDNRLYQEILFFADKIDVTEEIVRVKSHIQQFKSILKENIPIGQKLTFLLQEFLREFNTITSKVTDDKITHIIVNLKTEIERIREQVQNIE